MSEHKSQPGFIATIAVTPIVAVLFAPLTLFYAAAARDLWNWFALPLGAPAIGYWHFVGLLCLKSALMYRAAPREHSYRWYDGVVVALLLWLVGGFAHWMMGGAA